MNEPRMSTKLVQKRYVSVSRMNNENNGGKRFEVGLESVFPTLINHLTVDG